jgi:ribosomal protein S24E
VISVEVDILSKKDNKLFGRKEVSAKVSFTGPTPKRADIKKEVAGKLTANPDNCVLRDVEGEFGMKRVKVLLHAYDTPELLKKSEPRYILVREGMAQKAEKKKKEKNAAPAKKK